MLADDDFIAELAQGTTNEQNSGDDANSGDDYKFERDDDDHEEDSNSISA